MHNTFLPEVYGKDLEIQAAFQSLADLGGTFRTYPILSEGVNEGGGREEERRGREFNLREIYFEVLDIAKVLETNLDSFSVLVLQFLVPSKREN